MAPDLPNLSVLSSSLFFSVLLCLLKQSWIDSKDFFNIFCWPDHHPTLVMSADCLLGALLADLLICVVLFFQSLFVESVDVCVRRICWALCFSCQSVLVISISVCLKCFPASYLNSVWKGSLDVFRDQPNIFLSVFVWWIWSRIV